MQLPANFPSSVWNGLSGNDFRTDITRNINPNYQDWDQAVAEVRATETYLLANLPGQLTGTVDSSVSGGVVPGNPVAFHSGGTLAKGGAGGVAGLAHVFGLAAATAAASASVAYQARGPLTLTTAQWDTVAGTSGGLTAGTVYYVSATAGSITSTAPSTSGQFVNEVGTAMSATTLFVAPTFIKVVP